MLLLDMLQVGPTNPVMQEHPKSTLLVARQFPLFWQGLGKHGPSPEANNKDNDNDRII